MGACLPASNTGSVTVNPTPTIVVDDPTICIGDDAIITYVVPLSGQTGGTMIGQHLVSQMLQLP